MHIIDEFISDVKYRWGEHGLDCAILGMVGEAGEVADLRKKDKFHDVPTTLHDYNVEVGDVLFYVIAYCLETNQKIDVVIKAVMDKLAKRYPDGFVPGGGIR